MRDTLLTRKWLVIFHVLWPFRMSSFLVVRKENCKWMHKEVKKKAESYNINTKEAIGFLFLATFIF
ncbi:hypothetical protein O6H91_03G035400 [Diphasiastrum complanatum]|uniref:Uncharacterized protein n=1 Tax=Diphasiastrum complanatum TaxID=34168 RepID=A0ACC2E5A7_DIPCM|nr:hypothetical protein O6H91_03G035400 [Diphasiastrum complanatum]